MRGSFLQVAHALHGLALMLRAKDRMHGFAWRRALGRGIATVGLVYQCGEVYTAVQKIKIRILCAALSRSGEVIVAMEL